MKITPLNRILLLLMGLLAAYEVAAGINGLAEIPIVAYTIAFGVILVAGLLLIILGFDVLESPIVVVLSTIIPLSLSLGLVWQRLPSWREVYLAFATAGFLLILLTRLLPAGRKLPLLVLGAIHGIAGMVIFLLPSIMAAEGTARPAFALVGLGGALIGLSGLLLLFLKAGHPLVPRATILRILPVILLLMTAAFVGGFSFG